ncbi:Protein HMF1 [Lasiodiplodia hormozganensis]|uniref:Protein HMF1 n=1 Tax=Lasiodiplodia hormozganensis TaxID=869390 RepID=A0AA39Y3T1_9PEZI|nr:Protein HMF1 [Lasiodiplodia hormozganensis]
MSFLRTTSSAFSRALDNRAASGIPTCRRSGHNILSRGDSVSGSTIRASSSSSSSTNKDKNEKEKQNTTMSDKIETVFTPESVARAFLSSPFFPSASFDPARLKLIVSNGLVFVSGMMPATKDGKQVEGSVAEKTHQMCRNARAVLEAAGSGLGKAVKVTVYFANLDDFQEMNEVYAEYFPHKPARSAIEARRLPAGTSMEMDIIAIQ